MNMYVHNNSTLITAKLKIKLIKIKQFLISPYEK